jgi:hypothetical protein
MVCEEGVTIRLGVVTPGTSVAEMVAEVKPLELAVNVVTPVPVALADTVTVCAVLKLDGVNVRLVGDAVRPAFPDEARLTVTFAVGALDSARVKVPVPLWVTFRLVGVAMIDGVVTVVSCAVTVADV